MITISSRSAIILCLAGFAGCVFANENSESNMAASSGDLRKAVFEVQLVDPVFPEDSKKTYQVIQYLDRDGFPAGYSMGILTEVCLNSECKIVDATMFWDLVGRYRKFELKPEKPLTKKDHVLFSPEDYVRLDQILSDRNSVLGNHLLGYLARPGGTDPKVDGVSGATPKTLQNAVVKDAAWTTWVMWQYANGDVLSELRRITEASCNPGFLKHLLNSNDLYENELALNHLIKYYSNDEQFLHSVLGALERGDSGNVGLSLKFLSGAIQDKGMLYRELIDSWYHMDRGYVPMIVRFMEKDPELSKETLEELTKPLDTLPYFPVNTILRLLEERGFFSTKTESDVLRLLKSDFSNITQRASEFLSNQKLSSEGQKQLAAFLEKNRG
jgi:hypothetical protein